MSIGGLVEHGGSGQVGPIGIPVGCCDEHVLEEPGVVTGSGTDVHRALGARQLAFELRQPHRTEIERGCGSA